MYTVTKDGKTFEQLETEINAKTFKSDWVEIFKRLYPGNEVLDDSWDALSGEQLYNRLRPFQMVDAQRIFTTKLPWTDVQNELAAYKVDLLSDLSDEFDYLQREKDYGDRFNLLSHWRLAADELGLFQGYNNPSILLKKIIDNDLELELGQLETKDAEIKTEADFQARVDIMEQGQSVGRRAVATIAQLNNDNNVTAEQVAAIYGNADVQAIITLLLTGSLVSAKVQIQALDLTGLEPMDQAGKDRVVAMIDKALGL